MKFRTAFLSAAVLAAVAGPGAGTPASAWQSRWDEAAVVSAFRAQLNRNPTPLELRRYSVLVDRYGWTVADVRRDIAERQDYRRYRAGLWNVDTAIRSAYLDILGREPDALGLRNYREQVIRNGWSEWDLRQALRESPEYRSANFRMGSADRIIRRAYNDILRREPDADGLANYRRLILEDGWDAQDVRWALRQSAERQDLRQDIRRIRNDNAEIAVRDAYRRVLGREPDADGMREYTERMRRDGWTQGDVERALLQSREYRDRIR